MLSKSKAKYIKSLWQQKARQEHSVFVAEGEKIALEWLFSHQHIAIIVCTADWGKRWQHAIAQHPEAEIAEADKETIESISGMKNQSEVILVLPLPNAAKNTHGNGWAIALDGVRDPGNMGAIIRIADWFGIGSIVCSGDTVDAFNPKAVQAAMGSHLRVDIVTDDLVGYLSATLVPKFAATLNGHNAYNIGRCHAGVLIIGSESHGITNEVLNCATHQVTIPRKGGAESLNAAISAGILCALLLPC